MSQHNTKNPVAGDEKLATLQTESPKPVGLGQGLFLYSFVEPWFDLEYIENGRTVVYHSMGFFVMDSVEKINLDRATYSGPRGQAEGCGCIKSLLWTKKICVSWDCFAELIPEHFQVVTSEQALHLVDTPQLGGFAICKDPGGWVFVDGKTTTKVRSKDLPLYLFGYWGSSHNLLLRRVMPKWHKTHE